MDVSLPIYVETRKVAGMSGKVHRCRPLFFAQPVAEDESLRRAMSRLARRLKLQLDEQGGLPRHDALARANHYPEMKTRRIKLTLDLKQRVAKCRFFLVEMRQLDRGIAFTPSIPDVWFEIGDNENLETRATEVLSKHYRDLIKQEHEDAPTPESQMLRGDAWIESLDLDIRTHQPIRQERLGQFASLWDETKMDGAVELDRVGRCLDWLYPDDLKRAVGRRDEVKELGRLLASEDRRPVLIVGARSVGKSTILHEVVHRRVGKRRKPHAAKRNVWLLSPQRLISGMSYVGQWENRLLAILKHAKKRDHVLYFDDIMGLFYAGISAQSKLCVADVLKTHVQDRHVRVLGEMTQEQFYAFQERDRALADEFHVIPVEETGESETLRILLNVNRSLELRYRTKFDIDVLPAVIELTRQYIRDARFPGKAAQFLRHLAVKRSRSNVTIENVYEEFHAKTGLALSLLDQRKRLHRADVLQELGKSMIGQRPALEAATDVVTMAKARLNEPAKPLATMLFLGPTGVGKTQCAKTLAAYLFGSPEKVLRFDMNEYGSSYAAARLVGTPGAPEGLLTSAVRQRPFSIVLLDEIEKGHPDVFDLLLQVTGEGRLTDAIGRTTDFSNCILVMTSNLGVKDASRYVGFERDEQPRAYLKAAESFFRPEFVNRVDRIIPFDRLSREDVRQIAHLLVEEVFAREGLARRRCVLNVDARAMEKIVDEGYHPQLGARALRRAIERQLTQPVANRLATLKPELPTVVSLYPRENGIQVHVEELTEAERIHRATCLPVREFVKRCQGVVRTARDAIESDRPTGPISPRELTPDQFRFFALEEQIELVRRLGNEVDNLVDLAYERIDGPSIVAAPLRGSRSRLREWVGRKSFLRELAAANDVSDYIREVAANVKPYNEQLEQLRNEVALLSTMLDACPLPNEIVLLARPLIAWRDEDTIQYAKRHLTLVAHALQLDMAEDEPTRDESEVLVKLSGPFATLAEIECGVHLLCQDNGSLIPIHIGVIPATALRDGDTPREVYRKRKEAWRQQAIAPTGAEQSPLSLGRVLRVYHKKGLTLDLRSGLTLDTPPRLEQLRTLMLSSLSLPSVMQE